MRPAAFATLAGALLAACSESALLPSSAGFGPHPSLPAEQHRLIPTVELAHAIGWPTGGHPVAASGTQVNLYAGNLQHPRWMAALPNGDVLVAESNAPPQPDDVTGVRGWLMRQLKSRAGAAAPSANQITLLRDTQGLGVADARWVLIDGLHSPFGMVVVGNFLYVADTDAVLRFPFRVGDTRIDGPGTKLVDLPAGRINHHWTKNLIANADGSKLYVTIGSNSNVGDQGMAVEVDRAAIWEVDTASGAHRVFASGLRNPNGLAWDPDSGALWVAVNERDELGSDLVPDYLTSVHAGAFYGWPYSYYGQHRDARAPDRPELVASAVTPDYALGAHTASLGLASSVGTTLPAPFEHGLFVGQHGSWNRRPASGYKVIFIPFEHGMPSSNMPIDVLTGFLSADGEAYGRPVGVVIDKPGDLLVADDVGNRVWRVSAVR